MRVLHGLADDTIPMTVPVTGTYQTFSMPTTPGVTPTNSSGDWWSQNITPILTTAIQTAGGVAAAIGSSQANLNTIKTLASSPYTANLLAPGVSPLSIGTNPTLAAQVAAAQAAQASMTANPLSMLTSTPVMLIGGGLLLAVLLLGKNPSSPQRSRRR